MLGIDILVDIRNSPEILVTFLKIFHSKVGWVVDANAFVNNEHWKTCPNQTARYFCIGLEEQRFTWSTHDGDVTARGRYQIVETVEEAISIAEFAVANADVFKCDPTKPFVPAQPDPEEPVIQIQDDYDLPDYIDIEKLKEAINIDSVISFKKAPSVYDDHYYHKSSYNDYYNTPYSFYEEYKKTDKESPKSEPFKYISIKDLESMDYLLKSVAGETFKKYVKEIMKTLNEKEDETKENT